MADDGDEGNAEELGEAIEAMLDDGAPHRVTHITTVADDEPLGEPIYYPGVDIVARLDTAAVAERRPAEHAILSEISGRLGELRHMLQRVDIGAFSGDLDVANLVQWLKESI